MRVRLFLGEGLARVGLLRVGGKMGVVQSSPIEQCLAVGQQVIFYPETMRPGAPRLESVLRGWQRGAYLLLEVRLESERNLVFREGEECSIRFLKDGVAFAIESTLIDWQVSRREPTMRVSWPRSLRSAAIRRQERIDVSIPCTLRHDEETLPGTLRDISSGGCALIAECNATPATQILLSCTLPDGISLHELPVMVRSARVLPSGQSHLGCSFVRGDHRGFADIAFYVATCVLRMRRHTDSTPRYLIVGRESPSLAALRGELDPAQCNVVTAGSLLDALVHARLIVPVFILIEFDWGSTDAMDACRILRASPAHQDVPIFVYGRPSEGPLMTADEATVRQRVLEAGGTDCFPGLPNRDAVQDLLDRLAPGAA